MKLFNTKKIILFFLVCLFIIPIALQSQESNPISLWDQRYGGNSRDTDVNTIRTSDGGFLITSSSLSGIGGNKNTTNQGDDDWWVIKTDDQGKLLWEVNFGGVNEEGFEAGAFEAPDGSLVLAGRTRSGISGDIQTANLGADDILVVKLSASGELIWQNRFGGNGADVPYDVIINETGHIFVGGYTTSSNLPEILPKGSLDAYLIKLNGDGQLIWQKTFGGAGFESIDELRLLPNGGLAAAGYTASTDLSAVNNGSFDYWLFEVDANGTQLWERLYGGAGLDAVRSMAITSDGGILLGGQSGSGTSGDHSQENQGLDDMWIVKTNATGAIEWEVAFGGNGLEWAQAITPLADGSFLTGGFSNSTISGDKTVANLGGFDVWYIKSNATGEIIWQGHFGGTGGEAAFNIPFYDENNGEIYISGTTTSSIGEYFTTEAFGGSDNWLAKLQLSAWESDTITICEHTSAQIEIPKSLIGKSYQLKNEKGELVGNPIEGNGSTIQLTTNVIKDESSFDVFVQTRQPNGSLFEQYLATTFVKINTPVDLSGLVLRYNEQICYNKKARIKINNTVKGFIYELIDQDGQLVDSKAGNGQRVVLKTDKLKSDRTYRLMVSDQICSTIHPEEIAIDVLPKLKVDIKFNPNGLGIGEFIEFETNDDSKIIAWTWEFENGKKAYGKKVKYRFKKQGFFEIKVTVENTNGCKAVIKKRIQIKDRVFVSAPGVFRPNGHKGIFKVKLKNTKREQLVIRNLQGQPIYSGKNAWRGNSRNGQARTGWYIYNISAQLDGGAPYVKRGMFYLKR